MDIMTTLLEFIFSAFSFDNRRKYAIKLTAAILVSK